MSYPKLQKESYANAGGINTKMSVYITGEREVLDLVNYDLQNIGAWTQRPGMTTGLAGNTFGVGASNRFNFGLQTYRIRTGIFGITFTQRYYLVSNSLTFAVSLSNGVLTQSTGGSLTASQGYGNAVNITAPNDLISNVAYAIESQGYVSSGFNAFKIDVSNNIYYYGLPYVCDTINCILTAGGTGTGSSTGAYFVKAAYRDVNGFIGVLTPLVASSGNLSGNSTFYVSGASFTTAGLQSGATTVVIYANRVLGNGADDYVSIGEMVANETRTFSITSAMIVPDSGFNQLEHDVLPNLPALNSSDDIYTANAIAVEIYANRLWLAQAGGKNILLYSDFIEFIYDAQFVAPENFLNIENSSYPITGIKAYNQSLIVFFQKGVSRLTGDTSVSFNLQTLTAEYGLVSSRALVIFKDVLWFLDEYQIIQFNGSNFDTVSNPVQGYLSRMNVDAAAKTAVAYHYEDRNEVWFAIPIDGSNENNIVLVYDYNSLGWYAIKSTSNFTCLQQFTDQSFVLSVTIGAYFVNGSIVGNVFQNNSRLYIGHPGGSLGIVGTAFRTDYGNAFTMSFKTRYHGDQGKSTTMEWRRFFLDNGPWAGVTLSFNTRFYTNYSTSTIALTRTIYFSGSNYSGQQQTRIDFGLSAKSLSIEPIISSGASVPIMKVYGYTIESRFLRNV